MEIEMLGSTTWVEKVSTEELRAAELQAKEDKEPSKIDSKFLQTVVLLGFGGALLARYYAFIGYIPEIEWKESLTYLSVLALSGTGLLALYGLLLFLPGVIWSELLVCEGELQGLMCFKNTQGKPELCPIGVAKAMGIPFAVFLIIAHMPMAWGSGVATVLVAGLVGLIPALVILRGYLNKELRQQAAKQRRSLLTRYLSFFGLSALVSLVAMVVLYNLLADPSRSGPSPARYDARELAMLAACSLISLVANLAVALQYRQWRTRAVVTGIVAAFLLFLAGESIPRGDRTLSARIIAQFGVGDQSEHTLFLNPEGIQLATALGLLEAKSASISKVQILSGLGRSYYLQIGARRIVFPKDKVLAWETTPVPLQAPKTLQQEGAPAD